MIICFEVDLIKLYVNIWGSVFLTYYSNQVKIIQNSHQFKSGNKLAWKCVKYGLVYGI